MLWKVVTVDDELLVRNHLRSLIDWEEQGFTLCGEAGDGVEALQVIEELNPDLAIVDMNMPGMDGVELIRRLTARRPALQLIALSSFDSYDYVRGSLSYGAVDYLLKHRLTPASLAEVLGKVRSRLENERRLQQDRIKEQEKWEMAGPAVSQSYFRELLIGASAELRQYREHFQDMPYGRDGQRHVLVLMKLLQFELLLTRMKEQELALFIRSVVDVCGQILGDAGCAIYMERGTFAILLSMEDGRSENALQQQVASRLARIEKSVELYFNSSAVFARSGWFRTVDALPGHYPKLLQKLDELQGLAPAAADAAGEPASYITISQEKELLAAAEAMDAEETSRVVRDIVSACEASAAAGRASVQRSAGRLTAELLQLAAKIAQKRGLKSEWIFQELAAGHKQSGGMREIEETLLRLFDKLIAQLRESDGSRGYTRYVAQAIQAIQAEYKDGLTLEETAERLRITPAYLSRLFKEETGSTFTEYLTAYRIERSRQLIRRGTCTVKEICHQVGFNSYSYFIKVFKEHTGETPHVYARRHGG